MFFTLQNILLNSAKRLQITWSVERPDGNSTKLEKISQRRFCFCIRCKILIGFVELFIVSSDISSHLEALSNLPNLLFTHISVQVDQYDPYSSTWGCLSYNLPMKESITDAVSPNTRVRRNQIFFIPIPISISNGISRPVKTRFLWISDKIVFKHIYWIIYHTIAFRGVVIVFCWWKVDVEAFEILDFVDVKVYQTN